MAPRGTMLSFSQQLCHLHSSITVELLCRYCVVLRQAAFVCVYFFVGGQFGEESIRSAVPKIFYWGRKRSGFKTTAFLLGPAKYFPPYATSFSYALWNAQANTSAHHLKLLTI